MTGLARPLVLIMLLAAAPANRADELLDPDRAFSFSAGLVSSHMIEVNYQIAEGYYLYRDAFRFSVEPRTARIGKPQFPKGTWHIDEFFGRSEIYRHQVTVLVPLETEATGGALRLVAVSRGCADIGVCYLPLTQVADLVPSKLFSPLRSPPR